MDLVALCLFAGFAGFVDAIGGGGGLIQLPALMVFLPPAVATPVATVLGTNKLSSICGTGMALAQYARRIPIRWRTILPAAGAALALSWVGACTVTRLPGVVLKPLVIVLLVGVALYTVARKDLGARHAPRLTARREFWAALAIGAAIGFYDGFFGPGTGSFLIFAFIGLFGFDFLAASASAKLINFATNLSAVTYFALTDHIAWGYAWPMAVCNVAGATLGARLAILKGNRFVRGLFLAVLSGLILRLGYDTLRGH